MQKLVAALPKRPTNSWFDSGWTFIMLNILFFFVCVFGYNRSRTTVRFDLVAFHWDCQQFTN